MTSMNAIKTPKKILADSLPRKGTQVLHLETGAEALIPYCSCDPNANYRCSCDNSSSPQYAGCGPGYWYRVFRALKHRGWDIIPEDFGATIAVMIYNGSDLLVPDGKWDEWEARKEAKAKEIWENYE